MIEMNPREESGYLHEILGSILIRVEVVVLKGRL